jgi:hypothetical protein
LKLGQQWAKEKKGQLWAKERFSFLFFFFFFGNIFFIVQHKTKRIKKNRLKKKVNRQEIKPKRKRNCNLWTTLGGEFTVDGEVTETGGFAAGYSARGGRLGQWRSCRGRMLEKTPEVVLQWSTQTLWQGTVICIFIFIFIF